MASRFHFSLDCIFSAVNLVVTDGTFCLYQQIFTQCCRNEPGEVKSQQEWKLHCYFYYYYAYKYIIIIISLLLLLLL